MSANEVTRFVTIRARDLATFHDCDYVASRVNTDVLALAYRSNFIGLGYSTTPAVRELNNV
jgi:hypothetical protein